MRNRIPRPRLPQLLATVLLPALACTSEPSGPRGEGVPQVSIDAPVDGDTVVVGPERPTELEGSATDREDGRLTGTSLLWRSDDAGRLGTGRSVSVTSLPLGAVTVSLRATDSDGNLGTASHRVTVIPPGRRLLISPDTAVLTALGDSFRLTAVVADEKEQHPPERPVEWSSGDPGVATVDGGLVTARSKGTVTVTASTEGLVGEARVEVRIGWGSVTAGFDHTCGLTTHGVAYCWGSRDRGQLGTGGEGASSRPVRVSDDLTFTQLDAGDAHTCGLTGEGELYCWGVNRDGQLGDGSTRDRARPTPVAGGRSYRQVSAGAVHTCAVTEGGEALCWGDGDFGKLGIGSTLDRHEPVPVNATASFSAVSAGADHTCGIVEASTAACWGRNQRGQLGNGTRVRRFTPDAVPVILVFRSISAGGSHTCSRNAGRAALCWGANGRGQLGDGTGRDQLLPTGEARGLTLRQLSAGRLHSCGVTRRGRLFCWGDNTSGQLGNGSGGRSLLAVEAEAGPATFRQVSAGRAHTCAVTADAEAYCWGRNGSGQLGTGDFAPRSEPARVVGGPDRGGA